MSKASDWWDDFTKNINEKGAFSPNGGYSLGAQGAKVSATGGNLSFTGASVSFTLGAFSATGLSTSNTGVLNNTVWI
jgi:hypothetical protein